MTLMEKYEDQYEGSCFLQLRERAAYRHEVRPVRQSNPFKPIQWQWPRTLDKEKTKRRCWSIVQSKPLKPFQTIQFFEMNKTSVKLKLVNCELLEGNRSNHSGLYVRTVHSQIRSTLKTVQRRGQPHFPLFHWFKMLRKMGGNSSLKNEISSVFYPFFLIIIPQIFWVHFNILSAIMLWVTCWAAF